MSDMNAVAVVWAQPSNDGVSTGLRRLTTAIDLGGHGSIAQGLLGGTHGYGADFENDVFMMHPFCWCDRDDCPWCMSCSCPDEAMMYLVEGESVDLDVWLVSDSGDRAEVTVPEFQCDFCKGGGMAAPNFLHKSSGSKVWWYKYIGRSMEVAIKGAWPTILAECLVSLPGSAH